MHIPASNSAKDHPDEPADQAQMIRLDRNKIFSQLILDEERISQKVVKKKRPVDA